MTDTPEKQQINQAKEEREKGDLSKSLELFLTIDRSKLDTNMLFNYLGELALTYWHLKDYEKSKNYFLEAQKVAESTDNKSHIALALRQLSRPELNTENPQQTVEYAKQARKLAFEAGRSDLPWFDHGVITALISAGESESELQEWFKIEAEDLYKIGKYTNDSIAKWVWTTGLLIDRSKVFNTIEDLYLALMIAEEFNLKRRIDQIQEEIERFSNAR